MNKLFKNNLVLILFLTIMILILLQGFSFAKSENVQMIKKNENEYIIYISDMLNQEFEFAFSNSEEDDNLIFEEKSGLDKLENGNSIAYIDADIYDNYFKEKEETFLWVKQGDEYKIEAQKIKLSDALTEEDIEAINNATKKFYNGEEKVEFEVSQKELPQEETEDGVTITRKIGILKILNGGNAKYSYNMVKAVDSSNEKRLIELATKINSLKETDDIYKKLSVYSEFKKLYNELQPEADSEGIWTEVKDSTIEQLTDSKTGEQYLVWLKQKTENESIIDVQIMTCKNEMEPVYETQQKVIKETSKMPITGDNITLFVIAGALIILIAIVIILKLRNKKADKKVS